MNFPNGAQQRQNVDQDVDSKYLRQNLADISEEEFYRLTTPQDFLPLITSDSMEIRREQILAKLSLDIPE